MTEGKGAGISSRRFAGAEHSARSLQALFVPLLDTACNNPNDKRRMLLPAGYLRKQGVEISIVSKEDSLKMASDIIYSQNRDCNFWISHADSARQGGRPFVFGTSDCIGISTKSKVHDFDAFSGKESGIDNSTIDNLRHFLSKCCTHVITGSHMQARTISNLVPTVPATVIYDSMDEEIYDPMRSPEASPKDKGIFTLIWEGFCDNVPYLLVCADAIRQLSRKIKLKVIIATSRYRRNEFMGIVDNAELARVILGDSTEFHVWDRGSIATLMAEADVALAPLFTDCQFASAKPPHKAIIYNYMKLPVIASPTEEYKLYIEEGLNGFIASTSQEWVSSLEFLYKNPDKRVEMGACGHARAQGYSIEKIGSRLLNLFLHVCSSATAPN